MGGDPKEAREYLNKKYPKLFKTAEKRENKQKEMNDFILKEFNFNPREMTIASYLKMTEAVVESILEDKKE